MILKKEITNEANAPKNINFNIETYPDKEPERFLNDFFKTEDFTNFLTSLFISLFGSYPKSPMERLWEPLLDKFGYEERNYFSKNLWDYVFSIITDELSTNGEKGRELITVPKVRKFYLSLAVDYMKLFLRNHLLRQEELATSGKYIESVDGFCGYFFHDIACHELGIGKTFVLRGHLRSFEQDTNEIHGVQNTFFVVEDYSKELYTFEINKRNFKKFQKVLEREIDSEISFKFNVTRIVSPNLFLDKNETQGELLGLV